MILATYFVVISEFTPHCTSLNQVRFPKLDDKQLVALNLTAEALGIDSERYSFKQLPDP